jgi:hypothetical protein
MKKYSLLFISLMFLSCNQKQNLILKTNDPVWVAYEDYHFENEIIVCNTNENAKIILNKKLNESDSIIKLKNNTFIYTTNAKEIGQHTISGTIINNEIQTPFEQQIIVLPKAQPIGYNIKNANELKLKTENEISISLGLPKSLWKAKTDNGKLIKKDNNYVLIPERLGKCVISFETNMPSKKQTLYSDLIFNVVE